MAKHGYYTHGNKTSPVDKNDWVPQIDKDPFYRTNDIFNGIYHRTTKLAQGTNNSTDLKTVWVNFSETVPEYLVEDLRAGRSPGSRIYLLRCGHTWEGKLGHAVDGSEIGECHVCGAEEAYCGFEHEWQHIIFKSDIAARQLFCEGYAQKLALSAPGVDIGNLTAFLSCLVNVFDDIRCNSLWEYVYPGSADKIWKRWKRLTIAHGKASQTVFLSFLFAVAFDIPTDQSAFEPLRPIVAWGMKKVRGRGFMNMLVDVRVVVERCMDQLLSHFQTPPPSPMNVPDPGSGQNPTLAGAGMAAPDGPGVPPPDPSSSPPKEKKTEALDRLMAGAKSAILDPQEFHRPPTPEQLQDAKTSQSTAAMLNHVFGIDTTDPQKVEVILQDHVIDPDMNKALDQLRNGMAQLSADSLLTGDAKSKIVLIDVTSTGVHTGSRVELDEGEQVHVRRMRAAFYKALGKRKAKRSEEGHTIYMQALLAYLTDHQDPEVFESEGLQKGFAYSILCDMSSSMRGTFPTVCHAAEMLKQALHFPFVTGHLWGFRGGQTVPNRIASPGEVWIYRYASDVTGYTGTATIPYYRRAVVPVGCGGLTPMNPALKVTVNHLWKKVPAGTSKRLFLLTDGSPMSKRTGSGTPLPEWMLRRFVAKEITIARKHNIQVYTIVIGKGAIPVEQCKEMFGPPRFWRRVEDTSQVGNVLAQLVLENFQKYLSARG